MHRAAFTLIELLLVLTIIAIVLTVVMVRMAEPQRAARLEDALERIALADTQLRHRARRSGRSVELVIDLDSNLVQAGEFNAARDDSVLAALGPNIRIDRVVSFEGITEYGATSIGFSPGGQSTTYALRLSDSSGNSKWLMFAGLSGQMIRTDNEKQIQNIIDFMAPSRLDSD